MRRDAERSVLTIANCNVRHIHIVKLITQGEMFPDTAAGFGRPFSVTFRKSMLQMPTTSPSALWLPV
ncbi:unnamed protein product [Camellia sinensis]